mmetsp:Transcript_30168/g.71844  ORF Transcript_30168/g.71844 Transcript_30168/m.71844 type:complete len:92 (+) Transcript_30168:120-395(+)
MWGGLLGCGGRLADRLPEAKQRRSAVPGGADSLWGLFGGVDYSALEGQDQPRASRDRPSLLDTTSWRSCPRPEISRQSSSPGCRYLGGVWK